jgi:soluble cytochrome b562
MSRFARAVAFGSMMLLVALVSGPAVRAADDDKEIKKAQQDVLDLAKKIAEGQDKNAGQQAGAIKKKYEELNTVMHIYKPSPKGGIGTGLEPKAGDGIELKIISLGKRALQPATMAKEKELLVKMGYINVAMAEITTHYAPAKPKGGKGAKEWKQYSDDMKKASLDLIKAAKAGKPADVKTAANNLNNACNNCHSDFRDS